jgi:SAM-dependent methyltransferase
MGSIGRIFAKPLHRNSSRERLLIENRAFAEQVPRGSLVLDAGAGDAPYRPLFAHTRYESADFQKVDKEYAKSTYVCDLTSIPVDDARFDYVILNQVLEHVPHPDRVLKELFRVLKPGGRMIYSAPLFYEEHEIPYDFFRYTQFSVRMLFEEAGFNVTRLDWLEGYFSTVAYQLNTSARYLPGWPAGIAPGALGYVLVPFFLLLRLSFAAISIFFHWLEMKHKFTSRGYPKNYVAIAERPA